MSTYSKTAFSGSTNGKGVKVVATAIGTGTTIHTAQASTSLYDLITIFAYNGDTVQRTLTLGWGGTTDPDNVIILNLLSKAGLILVVADLPLDNSLIVKAACDAANVIVLYGYVNVVT